MVKFLALQYRLGNITAEQLHRLVGRVLALGEYKEIVGGDTDVH